MRLWYPVAGPKLVASLSITDFGLPENESKITLLLLAAFPGWWGWQWRWWGSFRAAHPSLGASSPQTTVYLCQKHRNRCHSYTHLSFVLRACSLQSWNKKWFPLQISVYPRLRYLHLHLYNRTYWATVPWKDPWLIKIRKCIVYIDALLNNKGFRWVGSTVRYSPQQFAWKTLALGRPPFQQQLLGDPGLEGRVKEFAGW